jgi:hypothetical protein
MELRMSKNDGVGTIKAKATCKTQVAFALIFIFVLKCELLNHSLITHSLIGLSISRHIIGNVHFGALVAVSQIPTSVKHQLRAFNQ